MQVGIVGLGLMGGSLALDLKKKGIADRIVGYDRNPVHCQQAISLGLVDKIVDFEQIKTCDVIFLAIPVEGIIKALQQLTDIQPNTTIIDLGSTKEKIVKSCPPQIRKNFVAAHPMTGTEFSGPEAAIEGLYYDKIVVLCNIEENDPFHKERAENIFVKLGMQIVMMDAHEHDLHAAYISHLPHAISYALANSVLKQEDPKSILILAAGGFKDMSRLAKSNPAMWSDIFKQNKENLLRSFTTFNEEFSYAKELIEKERWEELEEWMKNATTLHQIL
ncbi:MULTISPECIES: prephenate dehydrogenase [unclassified Nitratiruptor]|uniref:prephenate dehydrogenase n=1 Tax=unclassified Nitratiruptor TaxID=2624044 RepID=UPI0019158A2D|nr:MULTISPECIES: prephenate dehydrogenase [unclassified Nitratiruptor]BCD59744.1 prephenate dehydrogenase [Nitratiruptor sp. YY08-10]BCD63668.1 prephenate dehydrogenase [Nitratiruptor sp. YY08-14]